MGFPRIRPQEEDGEAHLEEESYKHFENELGGAEAGCGRPSNE